ncbi:sugar transferase [Rhodosalinus sp. FB01]|uniref:sugar transferase n=1 Tax=Rhodosalinus sp. FB01 TaxID=3239194 RepID=UPI0035247529
MTTVFKSFDAAARYGAAPVDQKVRRGPYRAWGKRVLDVILTLALAPVALPLIAVSALLAMLDGGAPFYRQSRVGRRGRVFSIVKIRTMVPGADRVLDAHLDANPAARREWDRDQKLHDDPRVTRIGALLRKTSLDELPQLWNVLTGDMSLVGPRPIMDDQRDLYPGLAYYDLRPGITGPWQVSERNACSFAERAEFDDTYHRTLSLGTDLGILVRTAGVVLRCTGK